LLYRLRWLTLSVNIRRICPGRFIGENAVWLTVSSFLAVFNLEFVVDAAGTPINPEVEVLPGFVSYVPFHVMCKLP
jgi:hypothetical protein